MAVFSLKIAPKHDTKICYPSIAAVTAEMGGFLFKEAPCRECRKRGSWNCPSCRTDRTACADGRGSRRPVSKAGEEDDGADKKVSIKSAETENEIFILPPKRK